MNKPTILITRSTEENISLKLELQNYGFDVCDSPLIQYRTIDFDISELSNEQNFIITSKYAAKVISNKAKFNIKCLVVGEESAKILVQNPSIKVTNTYNTAQELMKNLPINSQKNIYTYLCGNNLSFLPPVAWQLKQIYHIDYVDYLTISSILSLQTHKICYILIYSYNTAKNLIHLLKKNDLLNCLQYITIITISSKVGNLFLNIAKDVLFPKIPTHKNIIKTLLDYDKRSKK